MQINFNDWEFHELSKDLDELTVMEMLERHEQLDASMTALSVDYLHTSANQRRKNEKEYDALHRQQVFVAVRIAKALTRK